MINNSNMKRWDRLSAKNLNTQFINHVIDGMNCSPFEAHALLDCVYDVFKPLFDSSHTPHPGQMQLSVIDASVPPNVPLEKAKLRLVTLTLNDSENDIQVRKHNGVSEVRRTRMIRMATEAFQQGGLLTLEDFAYRIFNCGVRTLVNDLALLRKRNITVPLRSNVKDMGRAITHRRQVITLWLQGNEYSDIAHKCFHSIEAVANYVDKFKRCVALFNNGFDINTSAFMVHISPSLAEEFFTLLQECKPVSHRQQELEDYQKKNNHNKGE